MTDLKSRLKAMIRASGPISVATYMDLCLHDRRHGYYATRPGLGEDFITAPEISQVFGELIGLWLAHEWQQMGAPNRLSLVEIGPGRGTLMTDALRASAGIFGFHSALDLNFIEPSPVLTDQLSARFAAHRPAFVQRLEDLPTEWPILIIANEWLDCLPVQQFVRVGDVWHERVIGLSQDDELSFGLATNPLPKELSPGTTQEALEIQPGLKTFAASMANLSAQTPCRALLIDYGPAAAPPGDTLRSYQNGEQIDPLAAPGSSDLTCDVDFGRLADLLLDQGLKCFGPISQNAFLSRLGAETRLNQLAKQNPEKADDLYAGIRKLVDPAEMGERFQALCVGSTGLRPPSAF